MTDWLDDVLQQRPVDDDGFTARVTRLADAQRARQNLWRRLRLLVLVVVVLAAGGSCLVGVTDMVNSWSWDNTGSANAERWLDANRERVFAALQKVDAIPQLARRDGPDAADLVAQAMDTRDHTVLSGLGRYGFLSTKHEATYDLDKLAREHLDAAIAAPLVDGAPPPFVAAARDIEELGRLQLTRSFSRSGYFRSFELVNAATEKARELHKDGGFIPALDAATIANAQRLHEALWLFVSPGARHADFTALRTTRSVLVCGLVLQRDYLGVFMKHFLDGHIGQRAASLALSGCAEKTEMKPPCENVGVVGLFDVDNDETDGCFWYKLATLPPWRTQVRDSWYHLDAVAADALVGGLR